MAQVVVRATTHRHKSIRSTRYIEVFLMMTNPVTKNTGRWTLGAWTQCDR